ncbi:hypothetical protein V7S43_014379 [Phytophthora oleae]|uniref:Kinesin motor domain-containing protein n=1 Tax=Phytophthora oleae TaxID=2107226 RepID=A0ABD3F562_9STRA
MLFDFLEKERNLQISALFADAIHIESYDEELQQLLVQVEDEELLRQRVDGTWDFLAATSINQDIINVCIATYQHNASVNTYARQPKLSEIRCVQSSSPMAVSELTAVQTS